MWSIGCTASSDQADERHVDAAGPAVAAVAEEPLGLAARARRPVVDVLRCDAGALEGRPARDPEIDVVLVGPGHDQAGDVAERVAERGDHLGADLEAARTDR